MDGYTNYSHAPNAHGLVPAVSATPTNFFRHPLPTGPQSSVPNFKIKIPPPSGFPDSSFPEIWSPMERPQKRRKVVEGEKLQPSGVVSLDVESSSADRSSPTVTNNSKQQTPSSTITTPTLPSTKYDGAGPGMPFPAHRPRLARTDRMQHRAPARESLSNASIVYGSLPPPENAVRYPAGGLADYFPWEGTHNEDALTEAGIRSGHFEKVPNLPVELGSSRPSILSALKANGGIQTLSKLMGSALIRRAEIASVVSHNNFKPPPRVTLTDARREAWLKELANDNVPLRRLSKTIPHGIRGKALLEQCLAKTIPVWRAIWLIKCVGSNEIRAFRRRGPCTQAVASGTLGEHKWIKEWTESLLETMTLVVGDPSAGRDRDRWQQKLLYMLGLARRIYEEQLVDNDTFHTGLIRAFSTAAKSQEELITWMAVLSPYANDISKYCQRSRQLVDALLEKSVSLSAKANIDPGTAELTARCTSLATGIIRQNPQCAILPKSWLSYSTLLAKEQALLDNDGLLKRRLSRLLQQNAILDRGTQQALKGTSSSPATAVITLCEERRSAFEPAKLLASCQEHIENSRLLARTLLAWSIGASRSGLRPVFVTVRLLRLLHKVGFDAQEQVSILLDSSSVMESDPRQQLYALVVELVRSKHFSVSKYLQRRMVRGVSSIRKEHLEVLAYLPPQNISPEVMNLAASLCEHAECTFMVSPTDIQSAASRLDGLFLKSSANDIFAAEARSYVNQLQPNMKHALALHVRKEVISRRDQQAYPSPDDSSRMDLDSPSYAPPHDIITVLELLGDLPLFADVLLLVVPGSACEGLKIAARCVISHREVFQVIGALEQLHNAILKRYATLYKMDKRDRDLTQSLIDMMSMAARSDRTLAILNQHIASIASEHVGIAPSPISDQMVDVIQSQEVRSLADLESILLSGSVLEESVLQKMLRFLFRVLMSNATDTEQLANALKILNCVRNLNQEAFEKMFNQWLDQLFLSDDLRIAIQVVPWIIAGGLISIASIVRRGKEKAIGEKKEWVTSLAPNVFVAALKPPRPDFLASIEHYYRLKAAQNQFLADEPALFASLVGSVIESTSSSNEAVAKRANQLVASAFFESLCMSLMRSSATGSQQYLADELRKLVLQGFPIANILARFLRCDSDLNASTPAECSLEMIRRVAEKVGDSNLVPCQLLTQFHLSSLQHERESDTNPNLLSKAAETLLDPALAWRSQVDSWDELVYGMSSDIAAVVHSRALEELVRYISRTSQEFDSSGQAFEEKTTTQLLSVLEATDTHLSAQQNLEAFDLVHECIEGLASVIDNGRLASNTLPSLSVSIAVASRLAGMHLRSPHEASVPQNKILALCIVLAKCLTASIAAADLSLEAVLVHSASLLSPELRGRCLGILRSSAADRRVEYILGSDDSNGATRPFLLVDDDVAGTPDSHGPETPNSPQRVATTMNAKTRTFNVDPWETLQDATPVLGANDTCLDLGLFGTRKTIS